ncbi:cytochrome (ubi)quinol oxidase subunit III [Lichenihabitans sp. Uapishka_5]|uniref:cytochrome (ubi)quinol oxidase subunit III n=1 Tax=Lichenihabitans sp. Uapishka_5 TaxID=3037302 RepID=UPI0029E7E6B9|nr:cytochrome (ubi)quinol oxidase subunit III [Lichenihabitans sp. Uapishka_5]MDX7953078.1 cytochrome (ubi)quinol oxidase subunit III [Lichenihabitans sp. Uapishka_5]
MSSTTSAFAGPGRRDPAGGAGGKPPAKHDPYGLGRDAGRDSEATGHGSGGPSPKYIVVGYGFWIFILSDFITFATLFAAYAVLKDATAGGPAGAALFDRGGVALETVCLLLSSFTCGMATLAMRARSVRWFQIAMAATAVLGLAFLGLEVHEFAGLVAEGAGPSRSAFLSAFFTLVGCHGLHVSVGMLWLGTMMAQVWAKGFRDDIVRRTSCWALFWHALDIVWVGVFTVVYLMGVSA